MITIRELTPALLREYLDSEEFTLSPVISISRHRALSQISNPRVSPEDVVMLMAYEEEKLVGYLGIFADYMYLNGREEKAGWLSCMWVDPDTRGQGLARQLLDRAFECWEGRILVTEFTQAARSLYDNSEKFVELIEKRGVRGYLRFHVHKILPRRNPSWEPWRPVLQVMDWIANLPIDPLLSLWKVDIGAEWERVRDVDAQTDAFIQSYFDHHFTRRTAKDLNWMLQNPWVISGPTDDRDSARYFFDAVARRFDLHAVKLFKTGTREMVGFLILSLHDQRLKVPYWYVDPNYTTHAANLVMHYMLRYHMDSITLFNPQAVAALNSIPTPFFLKKTLHRQYLISAKYAEELKKMRRHEK